MTAAKECIVCQAPTPAGTRRRTCSDDCMRAAMSAAQSMRTGRRNSKWRGGMASHPLYDIYNDMIGRCERPTHQRYDSYGGRGISVCERWRGDFWAFVEDMGPRPQGKRNGRHIYSLDRIDNDGNYEPGNCRWATYSTQGENRRSIAWPWGLRGECAAGHPYTAENLQMRKDGTRGCRTCNRKYAASTRARRRAAA